MKLLRVILYVLLAIALLAIGAGFYISKRYNTIVQNVVLTNLSKQLLVPVDVQKVEFSVFSSFPYASLDFENVMIKASSADLNTKDTLFYFDLLKLNFNIVDLYTGKYVINRTVAEGGFANLYLAKNGESNFDILASSSDSGSSFELNLSEILLKDVNIIYVDQRFKNHLSGNVESLLATGKFSELEYDLTLKGSMDDVYVKIADQNYLKKGNIAINNVLRIGSSGDVVSVDRGSLMLSKQFNFEVTGGYNEGLYDFQVIGNNLDFGKIKNLLPSQISEDLKKVNGSGIIDFKLKVKGNSSSKKPPVISASFSLENGALIFNESTKFDRLEFSGTFNTDNSGRMENAILKIDSLKGLLPIGEIKSSFQVHNIVSPTIKGSLKSAFSLAEIVSTFKIDSIGEFSGRANTNIAFLIKLPDWKFEKNLLKSMKINGSLAYNEMLYQDKKNTFYSKAGNLKFIDNNIQVVQLNGLFQSFDFNIQGVIGNWIYYLLEDEKLIVKGSLQSKNLNVEDFMSENDKGGGLPDNIIAQLKTQIQHFSYKKFEADSINGVFTLNPYYLRAEDVSFKGMKGKGKGKLKLSIKDDGFKYNLHSELYNIDVNQFFVAFDNFGQSTIQAHHLKGNADASITASGTLNQDLEVDFNALSGVMDITINQGELINFEPFTELTNYFSESVILKRAVNVPEFTSRTQHIKFSNLTNKISVNNGLITIPEMKVKSSAMNIDINGTHSFNNDINYGLIFNLKDFLMREKSKDEFGEIKDDGLGGRIIYLKVKGTTENFDIELDKERKKVAKNEIIKKETEEIKAIINQEFRGSTPSSESEQIKNFEITWEEIDSETNIEETTVKKDTVKAEKKLKKLFNKILESEEEKPKEQEIIWDEG